MQSDDRRLQTHTNHRRGWHEIKGLPSDGSSRKTQIEKVLTALAGCTKQVFTGTAET